jgi:arabinofuranosyltransferase
MGSVALGADLRVRLYAFVQSYLLVPFIFLGIVYRRRLVSRAEARIPFYIVILWCVYTVAVGGDFMEFRQLVPVLPLVFVLVTRIIRALPGRALQVACAALAFVGSLHHVATFQGIGGIESIPQLEARVVDENEGWRHVGVLLEAMFADSPEPVTIATTASGAIPYYSRLPTVDMHGLNDRWIARHAPMVSVRPGHQREPTLAYLVDRGVNLVLGHPQVEPVDVVFHENYGMEDLVRFRVHDAWADVLPQGSTVVEIPLGSGYKITVLYLCRHPYIDEVIRELTLKTYDIRREKH